jgi:hypothetical protein
MSWPPTVASSPSRTGPTGAVSMNAAAAVATPDEKVRRSGSVCCA